MSATITTGTVWAGLLLTPVMLSAGQVLFKIASSRIEVRADVGVTGLVRTVLDPFLLTALAIYGVATIVWVYALRHIPLSQAYPVMAFSFNLVPLASFAFLGETLGLRYWIGAGMIVMNT